MSVAATLRYDVDTYDLLCLLLLHILALVDLVLKPVYISQEIGWFDDEVRTCRTAVFLSKIPRISLGGEVVLRLPKLCSSFTDVSDSIV